MANAEYDKLMSRRKFLQFVAGAGTAAAIGGIGIALPTLYQDEKRYTEELDRAQVKSAELTQWTIGTDVEKAKAVAARIANGEVVSEEERNEATTAFGNESMRNEVLNNTIKFDGSDYRWKKIVTGMGLFVGGAIAASNSIGALATNSDKRKSIEARLARQNTPTT